MIVRVLTARVPSHHSGKFNELLRQQLPLLRDQEGLVYTKLSRRMDGTCEEVMLFEEWRDMASLYGWAGRVLSKPRLLPGGEELVDELHVTHYEALDVDPVLDD
jgi:heme-degrading monooxygenase HmoA